MFSKRGNHGVLLSRHQAIPTFPLKAKADVAKKEKNKTPPLIKVLIPKEADVVKNHGKHQWNAYYKPRAADFPSGCIPTLPGDLNGGTKSRSWGAFTGETMESAFHHCVMWLWKKHRSLGRAPPSREVAGIIKAKSYSDYINAEADSDVPPSSTSSESGSSSSGDTAA